MVPNITTKRALIFGARTFELEQLDLDQCIKYGEQLFENSEIKKIALSSLLKKAQVKQAHYYSGFGMKKTFFVNPNIVEHGPSVEVILYMSAEMGQHEADLGVILRMPRNTLIQRGVKYTYIHADLHYRLVNREWKLIEDRRHMTSLSDEQLDDVLKKLRLPRLLSDY